MKESLFSYLVSYVPTDKRESKEDYLTQMFAWILKNIEGTANLYINYLCEKGHIPFVLKEENEIDISTQATVPSGRIDLLIDINHEIAFICEHKVHSELSKDQIKKYMDDAPLLGSAKYYSVLLTHNHSQHTQKADVSIVWADVYELFEANLKDYDAENEFVITQFLKYLTENDMGKSEMISMEALLRYWPVTRVEDKLGIIFRQLANIDYSALCPGIKELGINYAPTYNKTRWGRIGIDMFNEMSNRWNLGIFAGVMLNTEDHNLLPMDIEKGPDFVVFLESAYSKNKNNVVELSIYEKNIHSEKYIKLCQILSNNSGDFEFIPGIKKSPWRIAVLRMPLYDILYGTYKQSEQTEAIKRKMVEGINLILEAWNS